MQVKGKDNASGKKNMTLMHGGGKNGPSDLTGIGLEHLGLAPKRNEKHDKKTVT